MISLRLEKLVFDRCALSHFLANSLLQMIWPDSMVTAQFLPLKFIGVVHSRCPQDWALGMGTIFIQRLHRNCEVTSKIQVKHGITRLKAMQRFVAPWPMATCAPLRCLQMQGWLGHQCQRPGGLWHHQRGAETWDVTWCPHWTGSFYV